MSKLQIFSLISQKGGVGKTTNTMIFADVLHKKGHKVLVVDSDPQRSAQKWESKTNSTYPAYPVKVEAISGLSEAEFANWLAKRAPGLDFILIDTPPNLYSKELRAAMYISDKLILPFTAHSTSIDALEEMIPLIQAVTDKRGSDLSVSILLNKIDMRRASEKTIVDNAAALCPWPIMKNQLRDLALYADACNYRTSIYSIAGGKEARADVEKVVEEAIQ